MKIVRLTRGGHLAALTYADRLMRRCHVPIVLAARWEGRLQWTAASPGCGRHFAVTHLDREYWERREQGEAQRRKG